MWIPIVHQGFTDLQYFGSMEVDAETHSPMQNIKPTPRNKMSQLIALNVYYCETEQIKLRLSKVQQDLLDQAIKIDRLNFTVVMSEILDESQLDQACQQIGSNVL